MTLDSDLLALYKLVLEEEQHFTKAHQERLSFYSGLVTALLAAIAAGVFQASEWYHFAILCAGPVLLLLVSRSGLKATSSVYRRFLETITVRAKVEQKLGLAAERKGEGETDARYWPAEPLIPLRYISDRKAHPTSEEFVTALLKEGHQKTVRFLFHAMMTLSVVMLVVLAVLTAWKAL